MCAFNNFGAQENNNNSGKKTNKLMHIKKCMLLSMSAN